MSVCLFPETFVSFWPSHISTPLSFPLSTHTQRLHHHDHPSYKQVVLRFPRRIFKVGETRPVWSRTVKVRSARPSSPVGPWGPPKSWAWGTGAQPSGVSVVRPNPMHAPTDAHPHAPPGGRRGGAPPLPRMSVTSRASRAPPPAPSPEAARGALRRMAARRPSACATPRRGPSVGAVGYWSRISGQAAAVDAPVRPPPPLLASYVQFGPEGRPGTRGEVGAVAGGGRGDVRSPRSPWGREERSGVKRRGRSRAGSSSSVRTKSNVDGKRWCARIPSLKVRPDDRGGQLGGGGGGAKDRSGEMTTRCRG